jgi:hypothetical protein
VGSFQTATEAIDIIGTKEKAAFLKEIFSTIDFPKHLKGCTFIPRGMIQMTNVETFKQCIHLQNHYLNSVDCVPILGLSYESSRQKIVCQTKKGDIHTTLIGALELFPGIEAVYQTNMTPTNGKWLVVYKKEKDAQVKKFLDDELEMLFSCIPESTTNRTIGDYEYPRRPGLQRCNGYTLSYAQILQQRISDNPALGTTVSRPKRAPAAIVYHEADSSVPPLKKTNLGVPSSRSSTTSTVTTESLQTNDIHELIESKINSKINDVIYQTDQKIKAAVDPINMKIDRFDSNMNSNFKQLSDQMAQLFSSIQAPPVQHSGFVRPHFGIASSTMTNSSLGVEQPPPNE